MAILAGWNFKGAGGQTAVSPASVALGVSAATGIGSGLMPFNYLGNGLTGRKQTKTILNEAIADNEYIFFKITPPSGKSITITEIKLRPVSQNTGRKFSLFSNRKPFAAGNEIKTFQEAQIFRPLTVISVTGISGVTGPVEFRLYIYGQTNEWESVGIGERQAGVDELDLIVIGEVLSIPITQVPSVPTDLTASNITASGFTLSWRASTGTASYEVFANGTSHGTTASTSITLSGLAAGTYSMTVTARNATGTSPASSPLSGYHWRVSKQQVTDGHQPKQRE